MANLWASKWSVAGARGPPKFRPALTLTIGVWRVRHEIQGLRPHHCTNKMPKAKDAQVRVGGAIARSPARRRRGSVKSAGLLTPPWSPAFARDSRPRKAPAQAVFIDLSDAEEVPVVPAQPVVAADEQRARARRGARRALARQPGPRVVYLLMNKDNSRSYTGSTTDVEYRLRQHNMEIKGGARCTRISVLMGKPWRRALHVAGFANDADAREFEEAWKKANKKFDKKPVSLFARKMLGLRKLIPEPLESPLRVVWKSFVDMTWPGMIDE